MVSGETIEGEKHQEDDCSMHKEDAYENGIAGKGEVEDVSYCKSKMSLMKCQMAVVVAMCGSNHDKRGLQGNYFRKYSECIVMEAVTQVGDRTGFRWIKKEFLVGPKMIVEA